MTIRDRVRRWLGMETGMAATERHAELISALTELRAWMSEQLVWKHNREEDRHGELIEILTKLEQHFVSKHVGRPTTSIPVYDWEQVQIQELAEMLANPPKEEN